VAIKCNELIAQQKIMFLATVLIVAKTLYHGWHKRGQTLGRETTYLEF
jgi:hypothetical protein